MWQRASSGSGGGGGSLNPQVVASFPGFLYGTTPPFTYTIDSSKSYMVFGDMKVNDTHRRESVWYVSGGTITPLQTDEYNYGVLTLSGTTLSMSLVAGTNPYYGEFAVVQLN